MIRLSILQENKTLGFRFEYQVSLMLSRIVNIIKKSNRKRLSDTSTIRHNILLSNIK